MSESDAGSTGQVNSSAAEVYEDFFVPALFEQWPTRVLDAAGVRPGDAVLDIGCGTGVLARAATARVGGSGSVTGVDVFADRSAAINEMCRVTRHGGTLTIATWAAVDKSPGYAAMIELLRRLFGDPAAEALAAPFTLGTEDLLVRAMDGVPNIEVTEHTGVATFASLEAWIHTDVRGWTLADMIDDSEHDQLLAAAADELAPFVQGDGRVTFAAPALIATATLPDP